MFTRLLSKMPGFQGSAQSSGIPGKSSEVAEVILERTETSEEGTFGILRVPGKGFTCFTGELPDLGNRRNVSCIPTGLYDVAWTLSPRFKVYMYEVLNVPGRAGIRIHSANLMGNSAKGYKAQLNGCIAFGERIGHLSGQKALLVSKPAHRRFEEVMQNKAFKLQIK